MFDLLFEHFEMLEGKIDNSRHIFHFKTLNVYKQDWIKIV